MLKIYLTRHGQDLDNLNGILNGRRDNPLSRKGIEQANELANNVKDSGIHFDHIYSSPLQRAHKTAEIVADTLRIDKPKILDNLIERDFGIMTGKPHSSIKEMCSPDILQSGTVCYFLSPEGAETFPQLIKRAKKVLKEINSRHNDGKILLVTHGDLGKMVYAAYYGLNWKNVLTMFHFGNTDLLELSEGSSPESTHVFQTVQHNHRYDADRDP